MTHGVSAAVAAALAAAAGGHGEGGGGLLSVEAGVLVATWIVFVALLAILARFAWKPLLALVEERERKVRDDIAQAERARAEAERNRAEYEERLARAREESDRIVAEGRAKAEAAAERIVAEARAEAEASLERARRSIEEERRKAVAELSAFVGRAAVALARKILDEELDENRHRKLVERFTEEIRH